MRHQRILVTIFTGSVSWKAISFFKYKSLFLSSRLLIMMSSSLYYDYNTKHRIYNFYALKCKNFLFFWFYAIFIHITHLFLLFYASLPSSSAVTGAVLVDNKFVQSSHSQIKKKAGHQNSDSFLSIRRYPIDRGYLPCAALTPAVFP